MSTSKVFFVFTKRAVVTPVSEPIASRWEKKGEGKSFPTYEAATAFLTGIINPPVAEAPKRFERTKKGEE